MKHLINLKRHNSYIFFSFSCLFTVHTQALDPILFPIISKFIDTKKITLLNDKPTKDPKFFLAVKQYETSEELMTQKVPFISNNHLYFFLEDQQLLN